MKIRKTQNIVYLLVLFIILSLLTLENSSTPSSEIKVQSSQTLGQNDIAQGLVTRVIDGDTLVINGAYTVRLIGIDAPEKKGEECYSLKAQLALQELTLDQQVSLEKDTSDTDRYDRLLRYIWVGETLINRELVAQGYAITKTYPPDTKYQFQLESAQDFAQQYHLGLWGKCSND